MFVSAVYAYEMKELHTCMLFYTEYDEIDMPIEYEAVMLLLKADERSFVPGYSLYMQKTAWKSRVVY